MSQRRNKYKGKEHGSLTSKQDHGDTSLHSYNYLFDTIHPPESYTSSKYAMLVSSIHITLVDIMCIIGQYILLFGNTLWRYETRMFLVSILLSLVKVVTDVLSVLGSKDKKSRSNIRQLVTTVVILFCTLLPRYRWDNFYDFIFSISMIILVVYVCFRHDDEIDPSKTFYGNLFSNTIMHFFITSMYTILYCINLNPYAGDYLLHFFIFTILLQFLLCLQRLLFHSHLYANVYKYQGYWTSLPSKYKSSIEGKIEPWKPNHVYSFGSVVTYQDYLITGMGYLNNVKPFAVSLEFAFMCVFEKERTHATLIVFHMCITGLCCLQMILQSFNIMFVVMSVISMISLILMFPLNTMAFNYCVC